MRWVITGGCGFIGTSLIRDLIAEGGHFIRVIDNFCVGGPDDLAEVCEFVDRETSEIVPMSDLATPMVELFISTKVYNLRFHFRILRRLILFGLGTSCCKQK